MKFPLGRRARQSKLFRIVRLGKTPPTTLWNSYGTHDVRGKLWGGLSLDLMECSPQWVASFLQFSHPHFDSSVLNL